MKSVNLAKALKMKNALVGEINRLKETLTRENSRSELTTSTVNREQVYNELISKMQSLVVLKSSISKANVNVYSTLAEIAEAKGFIAYLKSLNTQDGIVRTEGRFGASTVDTKFSAFLTQEKVDAAVATVQKRIEELQDVADAYNATTTIQVEE